MLGYSDPHACPPEDYALGRRARNAVIERELREASPHVLRNVKNNISFIIRQGEELGLIRASPEEGEIQPKQFGRRKIGVRFPSLIPAEDVGYNRDAYSLPLMMWPAKLKEQYEAWRRWVTEAKVPRHYSNPRNRRVTVENKTRKFEAFFGYLAKERRIQELDFEMLIDLETEPPLQEGGKFHKYRKTRAVGLLEEFVRWHQEERMGRESAQAREVVSAAGSVARRYYFLKALLASQHDEAGRFYALAEEISSFRAALDEEPPQRIISAQRSAVSKGELSRAARAEFPPLSQLSAGGSGAELASRAGRALAIMMLLHHPFRNKYYREARLGRELVKTENGQWCLRFYDDEKGVSTPRRETREQSVSPEVVSYLEQYLQHWRPKLVRKIEDKMSRLDPNVGEQHSKQTQELENHKEVLFLHSRGGPFTHTSFAQWIQAATYRWLGVRVNPESIRSISLNR
jgi:hypothetical protein